MSSDRQFILQGTHLRDVLLRTFAPSAHPHVHAPLQAPDEVEYLPHEALEHGSRMSAGGDGNMGVFKDDMLIQSWAKRYAEAEPVVVEGDPRLEGLNGTQIRAMAMMIGQRISLVQGVRKCLLLFSSWQRHLTSQPCHSAPRYGKDKNHHRDGQATQGKSYITSILHSTANDIHRSISKSPTHSSYVPTQT